MEIENQRLEMARLTEEDKWCIVVAIKHFGLTYTEVEKKFQWANRSTIKIWNGISQYAINKSISHVRKTMKEAIKSNGEYIK